LEQSSTADGKKCIQIREKTLELSLTMYLYHLCTVCNNDSKEAEKYDNHRYTKLKLKLRQMVS